MFFQSFEDLEVWKKSCRQSVPMLATLKGFNNRTLLDQMTRSCISVPSNIAEGQGRDAPKEFIRFLNIAQGSNYELRTQLYISQKAGLLDNQVATALIEDNKNISSMLHGLIQSIRQRIQQA